MVLFDPTSSGLSFDLCFILNPSDISLFIFLILLAIYSLRYQIYSIYTSICINQINLTIALYSLHIPELLLCECVFALFNTINAL
ncbi:hypothetical protein FAD_1305 [Ferroplasma acidiphilum]|uniref:Uncharacterized protein n=1 Tax=Ferroplasma acidiphilum TaxID=74969 RepID=A0A1V0N4V8_9ARCH|nr:hypothetical protein FAD_1305 [Ferroplasma acidiphilum]